jgi:hypothetical protein
VLKVPRGHPLRHEVAAAGRTQYSFDLLYGILCVPCTDIVGGSCREILREGCTFFRMTCVRLFFLSGGKIFPMRTIERSCTVQIHSIVLDNTTRLYRIKKLYIRLII